MLGQNWRARLVLGLECEDDKDDDVITLLKDYYIHDEVFWGMGWIANCTPDLQSFLVE